MSAPDEREMILRMLQEGKISVEEADSLLDVLASEGGDGPSFRNASASSGATSEQQSREHSAGAEDTHQRKKRPDDERTKRRGPKIDFDFDIDMSGISDSIRSIMASVKESVGGVKESLKEAFEEMGDVSFSTEFGDEFMGKARAEEERPLSLFASDLRSLVISTHRGDIRIVGTNTDQVTGTATVTAWAGDEERAREILDSARITLSNEDGNAVLKTSTGRARVRIDLELTVPESIELEVNTVSGDLRIENVAGASVQSASGDISLANVGHHANSDQQIATQSGDIVASSVSGTMSITTVSGDLSVDEFAGRLTAVSQSGSVRANGVTGSVHAQTMSGDVLLQMSDVDGPLEVTSVSGDVLLGVPASASISLTAKVISGDISISSEFTVTEQHRKVVHATLGEGTHSATVSSVSGDAGVTVEALE